METPFETKPLATSRWAPTRDYEEVLDQCIVYGLSALQEEMDEKVVVANIVKYTIHTFNAWKRDEAIERLLATVRGVADELNDFGAKFRIEENDYKRDEADL